MPEAGRYELFTSTDAHELWQRIDAAAERFASLAREVDPALRLTGGSSWEARDVVGHVLNVVRRYTRGPTLGETPRDVDRINDAELAALGDATADVLIHELVLEVKVLRDAWAADRIDLSRRRPFHGGVMVDTAASMGNLLAELLVHGRDVAVAAGRPWRIEDRDALLVLNGVMQIVPAYARRSSSASLRLRLRVPGAVPWLLDFRGGTLTSGPAYGAGGADVVVRARPEALMLAMYSRLSSLQAARAGLLVVGGRRPWRITRLPGLIEKP